MCVACAEQLKKLSHPPLCRAPAQWRLERDGVDDDDDDGALPARTIWGFNFTTVQWEMICQIHLQKHN